MYDEKMMSACVLEHMYKISIIEAEDDERFDRRIADALREGGLDSSAQTSIKYTHEYEMNMARDAK